MWLCSQCCSQDSGDTCLLNSNKGRKSYESIAGLTSDLYIEDFHFVKECMNDIGWNIVASATIDAKQQWLDYIARKMKDNVLPQSRLENIYLTIQESISDGQFSFNMLTLLIYTRLFVLEPEELSSFYKIEALENLLQLFGTHYYRTKYKFHGCKYLLEMMMDILEDKAQCYDSDEKVRSLVNAILPFVAYYTSIEGKQYVRDLAFLETYLCLDNAMAIWAAVIMSNSEDGYKYLNVMRAYLENELMKEKMSGDIFIVYKAALQSAAKNGSEWSLTKTDHRLIEYIRKWKILTKMDHESINDNIIKIFTKVHRKDIFETIKANTEFTESQNSSLDCLSLALSFGLIGDDSILELLSILDDLHPYGTENSFTSRMLEMIIYHLYPYQTNKNMKIRHKIIDSCSKFCSNTNYYDRLNLSLLFILIHNTDDIGNIPSTEEIIPRLLDIIVRIFLQQAHVLETEKLIEQQLRYLREIIEYVNLLKLSVPGSVDRKDIQKEYQNDYPHQRSLTESHQLKGYDENDGIIRGFNPKKSFTFLGFSIQEIIVVLSKI